MPRPVSQPKMPSMGSRNMKRKIIMPVPWPASRADESISGGTPTKRIVLGRLMARVGRDRGKSRGFPIRRLCDQPVSRDAIQRQEGPDRDRQNKRLDKKRYRARRTSHSAEVATEVEHHMQDVEDRCNQRWPCCENRKGDQRQEQPPQAIPSQARWRLPRHPACRSRGWTSACPQMAKPDNVFAKQAAKVAIAHLNQPPNPIVPPIATCKIASKMARPDRPPQ